MEMICADGKAELHRRKQKIFPAKLKLLRVKFLISDSETRSFF